MSDTFANLGLSEPLLRATQALKYTTATPIQQQAIPVVLAGRDLIGCAQTGTGKTAAFTLPMLDRLLQTRPARSEQDNQPRPPHAKGQHPRPRPIRALVLSPTRELTAQIGDSFTRYGKFTPLRHTVVYGGVSQHPQVKALRHGVDTLIATPGRLIDLMDQGHIDLSHIQILVFDEADQMLDMGFLPALKRIVQVVPKQRQTLMFSATMPNEIRSLAQQWLTDPASVEIAAATVAADRIEQMVHLVDRKRKADLLSHFLRETPRSRTLIFSRTKHGADKIVKHLVRDGHRAAAIHGNKSQNARTRVLEQFKGKNPPVLVATDIAARGLDIRDISHVVNFDLPDTPETYVHRIGRTARAGAEGIAVSFCAGDERGLLRQIERHARVSIAVAPVIEGFEPTEPVVNAPPARGKQGGGGGGGKRSFGRRPKGSFKPGGGPRNGSSSGGPGGKAKRRKPAPAGAQGGGRPPRQRGQAN